jgi:hypothetical protein
MQRRAPGRRTSATSDWWWVFDPRRSLRARSALLVGAGTLAFTAALAWASGALYRHALETQLSATLETLAFQLSDKLDRTVYERYRTLVLGGSLSQIRDLAANPAERRRALEALQESSPDFAWLGLADPAGRILVATGGLLEGESAANRPWFRNALNVPYAGPLRDIPELGRANRPPVNADNAADLAASRFFDLAIPLTSLEGDFGGVLGAHVSWARAREVQLSVVPESLARERIGATVYSGQEVLLDSGTSGWTQPPDPPVVGELRRTRGALIEHTPIGASYLTGFARSRGYREFRGLGWFTVVRQPVATAFAPVAALRRSVAAWGCSLSLAAMAAAWVFAGPHARRLRSMRAAAERIHAGDILAVLPRPTGSSELARMCGAIGDLVEDLRARSSPEGPETRDPRHIRREPRDQRTDPGT